MRKIIYYGIVLGKMQINDKMEIPDEFKTWEEELTYVRKKVNELYPTCILQGYAPATLR